MKRNFPQCSGICQPLASKISCMLRKRHIQSTATDPPKTNCIVLEHFFANGKKSIQPQNQIIMAKYKYVRLFAVVILLPSRVQLGAIRSEIVDENIAKNAREKKLFSESSRLENSSEEAHSQLTRRVWKKSISEIPRVCNFPGYFRTTSRLPTQLQRPYSIFGTNPGADCT